MGLDARADALLDRLADALGCPVETFFQGPGQDRDAVLTLELFRLWCAIAEPQRRHHILTVARQEVERQGGAVHVAQEHSLGKSAS